MNLSNFPFFKDCPTNSLNELESKLEILVFQPEETIIHDGEIGDAMYFIVEGKVSVLNKSKNVLVALQKGDFFGALVLVFSILRTASVATLGIKPVTVARLGREDFDRFCEHHPSVREKLKRIAGEDFNRFTGVLTSPLDDVVNEGVYLKLLRDFLSYWDKDDDKKINRIDLLEALDILFKKFTLTHDTIDTISRQLPIDKSGLISLDDCCKQLPPILYSETDKFRKKTINNSESIGLLSASSESKSKGSQISRHIFPNRAKKEVTLDQQQQQNSNVFIDTSKLPNLPDLPPVPDSPKPDYKKERPLSKSQSLPKLKRSSISFQKVADFRSEFQKLEKENSATKDNNESSKGSRSVRIMVSTRDEENDNNNNSSGNSPNIPHNNNNDLSINFDSTLQRNDLNSDAGNTPLISPRTLSPSKSKSKFLARTNSRETFDYQDAKLKRANSEMSGFKIEFRAPSGKQNEQTNNTNITSPSSISNSKDSNDSNRPLSPRGLGKGDSTDLQKIGTRSSLRIIRRKKSVDPATSSLSSRGRERSATVQMDGESFTPSWQHDIITEPPFYTFSLLQNKVGVSKNKNPVVEVKSSQTNEVKDTRYISFSTIVEDLKPIIGFSISQIGVLKERTIDDSCVVLNTLNHRPYTFVEESQAPCFWVLVDLGIKKKDLINEKLLPYYVVYAYIEENSVLVCKLLPSEEVVLKLPVTEERVNTKKKSLKKKEIQREIVLYFSNTTTLIHQLNCTENTIKTVNGVKTNLKNKAKCWNILPKKESKYFKVYAIYEKIKNNNLDTPPPSNAWFEFLAHLTHRTKDEVESLCENNSEMGLAWNDFALNFYLAPKMHKQEVRQKIGNSLSVIIFNDSDEPFDPSNLFLGEWNVVICVVQRDVLHSIDRTPMSESPTVGNDTLSSLSSRSSKDNLRDHIGSGKGNSREHIKTNNFGKSSSHDENRSIIKHRISRKDDSKEKDSSNTQSSVSNSSNTSSSNLSNSSSKNLSNNENNKFLEVPSLNLGSIDTKRERLHSEDESNIDDSSPSVSQTPRTPHGPSFEVEQNIVNNPDCKYRLGFFVNYQQKFYTSSITDSKELIGDIEVVINELNCHPYVPKNALFDKATITDFILTKFFNTLLKISKHHSMLRKICFGASASKLAHLVETESPEWYSKLNNDKK